MGGAIKMQRFIKEASKWLRLLSKDRFENFAHICSAMALHGTMLYYVMPGMMYHSINECDLAWIQWDTKISKKDKTKVGPLKYNTAKKH